MLEKEETKELKLTPEDILIKSGIDFINHVKLPCYIKQSRMLERIEL